MRVSLFSDLIETVTERGRRLLGRASEPLVGPASCARLVEFADALLSGRGEASGVALARALLDAYATAAPDVRASFLAALAERFGPDEGRVARAVEAYRNAAGAGEIQELHLSAEPRRQELVRRLNLAPGGTALLVRMREDLLGLLRSRPELKVVDGDFAHLFASWFNRGFLVLKPVDWTTPANILERIIRYEAVHAIQDWDDLRRRIDPPDRRCFAFFHPALVDEPLIFVEVALTREVPTSVAALLDPSPVPLPPGEATTAVFYSISNCQKGLAGVSFGNFLIKQVAEDLRRALPNLATFVTLSPVPEFAAWLARERRSEHPASLTHEDREGLRILDEPDWHQDAAKVEAVRRPLVAAVSYYFLKAKTSTGKPVDPVARFHLGNGARLERLNFGGDLSPKGLRQAHGLMVNYLYALDGVEENHEAYAERGVVVAAPGVRRLLRADLPSRALVPVAGPDRRAELVDAAR